MIIIYQFIHNMNTTYTIARYEQVNNIEFLVAFNVKAQDVPVFYIESILPLSNISEKTSTEVCQLAFNDIKNKIDEIILRLKSENSLTVGSQFIPE